jgi:hypothetical protein
MALFGKKKEERPPPVDRARQLMAAGMAERDIIRTLKGEGYGFGEVEKALREALKQGVGAAPAAQPAAPAYAPPPAAPPPAEYGPPSYPPMEEYPAPPPFEYGPPAYGPPEYAPPMAPAGPEISEAQVAEAEAAMQEIVESLLDEKMGRFSSDIKAVKDEVVRMSDIIEDVKRKADVRPPTELPREAMEKLDDLEARVGGLEKAFRQFLPSLTENIEALSRMIHEMRRKQA